jgi:tetratricopeptide (TPR) repeat protein
MRYFVSLMAAFVFGLMSISACFSAAASLPFDQGVEQFNSKRYHAASDLFEKAIQSDPRNQKYHYYFGMCLEELKEYGAAQEEYDYSYRLNPFSTEGNSARQAILSIQALLQRRDHPVDSPAVFGHTVSDINRQSADVQQRWLNWGEREAAFRNQLGMIEIQNIQRNANQQVVDARRMRADNSMIMSEAQRQANYINLDTQVQANKYRFDARHAATETQLSANTLKQLLSEAPKTGQPHLRALGTNLYVRNYGTFDDGPVPEDPLEELRASALKFSDLPVEQHAVPAKLSDTKLSVLDNSRL